MLPSGGRDITLAIASVWASTTRSPERLKRGDRSQGIANAAPAASPPTERRTPAETLPTETFLPTRCGPRRRKASRVDPIRARCS